MLLDAKKRPVYPFIGSVMSGGGLALRPRLPRRASATPARLDVHAAWSMRNYKARGSDADAADVCRRPREGRAARATGSMRRTWRSTASATIPEGAIAAGFAYRSTTVGVSTRVQAARFFAVGAGLDAIRWRRQRTAATHVAHDGEPDLQPQQCLRGVRLAHVAGLHAAAAVSIASTGPTTGRPTRGAHSFRRLDAEVQQFIPLLRENWVIALRALASTTNAASGSEVPSS